MDIITCLRKEHDRVMKLFTQFDTVQEAGKKQLAMQLIQMLSVHEAAEEAAVWSKLRNTLDVTLIDTAMREEKELKQALKQLEAKAGTPDMMPLVGRVKELLVVHLRTEQDRIFPMIAQKVDDAQQHQLETAYRDAKNAQLDRMAKLNVTMAPEAPVEQKTPRS